MSIPWWVVCELVLLIGLYAMPRQPSQPTPAIHWVTANLPCRTCGGRPAGGDCCHLQVLPAPWQRPRDATQILCSPLPPCPLLCHHHQLQEPLWGICSELCERHHPAKLCVAGRSHGGSNPNHGSVMPMGLTAEWCADQGEGWYHCLWYCDLFLCIFCLWETSDYLFTVVL